MKKTATIAVSAVCVMSGMTTPMLAKETKTKSLVETKVNEINTIHTDILKKQEEQRKKEEQAQKEAEEKAKKEAEEKATEEQRQKEEQEALANQAEQQATQTTVNTSWNGSVLSPSAGVNYGPSGKETYYNLDMSGVVSIMRGMGNNDSYWVRGDGCKMLGNYIMVAANLSVHPRGSLVETSLGTGIVCDTGGFAAGNANQLDIATSW